ncbi:MAG: alpha-hydroxy acid oxidase [Acidobacteriota bacterium]
MADIERTWIESPSRRVALARLAGLVAASPLFGTLVRAQQDPRPFSDHRRLPGLAEMQSSFDFEPLFFGNVSLQTYDYTAHGDGSEFTLRRNREAFDWVDLLPRRAIDPAQVDLATELLGVKMKFPLIVAPSAVQVPLHPDGEIGMHKAATAASNTLMVLSQNTSTPVEQVASAATGPLWFQMYPQQDRTAGRRMIEGAQAAGCTAVVITVDQQASYYERTQQDRNLGGTPRSGTLTFRGAGAGTTQATGAARYRVSTARLWYTWRYLDEIRPLIRVPMLIKGVLDADDARTCLEHGADGIIVSNHGGRSMDYGPSTLEVLPEVVAAVGRRVPVITDSGYRRGTDILKALALGADAVMLGRTTRWGLGAFGIAGAQRLLELMQQELVQAAAASGCAKLADIDASLVRTTFV